MGALEGIMPTRRAISRKRPNGSDSEEGRSQVVTFYSDGSTKSIEAEELLKGAGLQIALTDQPVPRYLWPPIALFKGDIFEGLPEIKTLVASLAPARDSHTRS